LGTDCLENKLHGDPSSSGAIVSDTKLCCKPIISGWNLKIIKCPKEIFGDLQKEEETESGIG
jgi:hypothetical protein